MCGQKAEYMLHVNVSLFVVGVVIISADAQVKTMSTFWDWKLLATQVDYKYLWLETKTTPWRVLFKFGKFRNDQRMT